MENIFNGYSLFHDAHVRRKLAMLVLKYSLIMIKLFVTILSRKQKIFFAKKTKKSVLEKSNFKTSFCV